MLTLSIIVPCYNESSTILEVLEKIRSQSITDVSLEVVVIDDGSNDDTCEHLRGRPDLYDTLIERPINGGKGAAVKDGLGAVTGDYVLFQDADLEYDPADYARLLVPVQRFRADVVIGSRFIAPEFTRVHYFWHKVGNGVVTLSFNLLFNMTFTDIYSCYLMFRRDLLDSEDLRTMGWEQHGEILCKCVKRGSSFYEVPISYHGRTYDEGKKIRAHHALPILWTFFRERWFD